MPYPVGSNTIGIIASAVSALYVVAVGIGVGLLANRRTMTASIVAANIAGLIVTAFILYVKIPPEVWSATFGGMLFPAVTRTVAEGAVAHFVARKFRKKP